MVNEKARVQALRRYEILHTPPEGAFNHVAHLAAKLFDVPIALISLVDEDEVFFKAKVGLSDTSALPRDQTLCSFAVLHDKPTILTSELEDPCLLVNPLAADLHGLRFYAAVPLTTNDGYNIGTLCVLDRKPRELSEDQVKILSYLSKIVMDEMETRLRAVEALRAQENLMYIAAHDLKSPIRSIRTLVDMIVSATDLQEREEIAKMVRSSTDKMVALIERLVYLSKIENDASKLNVQRTDFNRLVQEVVSPYRVEARNKQQTLVLDLNCPDQVCIDTGWITEVLDNLVSNAIKYSSLGGAIQVGGETNAEGLIFWVSDDGQGFSEEDKQKAFGKFSRLSARPTAQETSSGLGLFIVKMLVEMHQGTVSLESEGKGKGSKITVRIPSLRDLVETGQDIKKAGQGRL